MCFFPGYIVDANALFELIGAIVSLISSPFVTFPTEASDWEERIAGNFVNEMGE